MRWPKRWMPRKTRILVKSDKEVKAVEAWAIRVHHDQPDVSLIHPVAPVKVVMPNYHKLALKMFKGVAKEEDYKAFAVRAHLGRLLGTVLPLMEVTHRRELQEPEGLAWTAMVESKNLQTVLQQSGKYGIIMTMDRVEEDALNLQKVFVDTPDLDASWSKVSGLKHYGFCGPTRMGQYIFRCGEPELADARRLLLGPASQFHHHWGLLQKVKYQTMLGSRISPRVLVESLKESLKWNVIVTQSKRVAKGKLLVTLAAEVDPPATELLLGDDLVVIEKVTEDKKTHMHVTFSAPREVASSASRPATSLPEVVKTHCDDCLGQLN